MHHSEHLLSPQRFITPISRNPNYLVALPKRPLQELPPDARHEYRQRAIARGAFSIAQRLERQNGESDIDAHLFKLVGELDTFYKGQTTLDSLRGKYGSAYYMPSTEKHRFQESKEDVIEFNRTLHELINSAASKVSFDQLLAFMKKMHVAAGGRETADEFSEYARESLLGARNEIAFEQVLIAGGVEYEQGTAEQDAKGGDFIINGVPIDVKAGRNAVERARQRAMRDGRDTAPIIWSHIRFEDFNGGLSLPYEKCEKIFAELKPDLDAATLPRVHEYVEV